MSELKTYLDKHKFNSKKLFTNIDNLQNKIAHAISEPLCNLNSIKNNLKFQLFGLDVIFNKNMDALLLEINKGPDMVAKDKDDEELKKKVQIDMFEKVDVIKINDEKYKNGFIKVL